MKKAEAVNNKNITEMVQINQVSKIFDLNHNISLKDTFVRFITGRKIPRERFSALDNVNISIKQGETVGLIGRNGSGKSTLLKCIAGVMQVDTGSIKCRGRIAGLIEVGAGFHQDLTGRENVYLNGAILGMTKQQLDEKFDEIVAFSEIEKFIDTEVRFYSSGMFLRLAFSVAVFSDPDIFLVDEILAVGDEPFRQKCMKRIKELQNEGKTMIIVSHDEFQVKEVCSRAIWLKNGEMLYDGDVNKAFELMNKS